MCVYVMWADIKWAPTAMTRCGLGVESKKGVEREDFRLEKLMYFFEYGWERPLEISSRVN